MNLDFFLRETPIVARDLIGKIFILHDPIKRIKKVTRIVETEAYRTDDIASHCRRGWTPRCAPMFEEPGHAYVYFIYGMYSMINFVTEPHGTPGAVLIRALEPLSGFQDPINLKLLNGPGKLTRELGITRDDNRESLFGKRFEVEDDGMKPKRIILTPRVGIKEDKPCKPWRFCWADHPSVSRAPQNKMILKTLKSR